MTTNGPENEETCGAELADSAEVPEAWRDLMSHVAVNLDSHAAWVGDATEDARRERDGMLAAAGAYRAMAGAAEQAASLMRSLRDLPAAPHDPARLDRRAFSRWMRTKIDLQRAFAAMLLRHAELSERALVAVGDGSGHA